MAVGSVAREVAADDKLRKDATNVIRWDPDLEDANIDVSVVQRWVTLRGAVDAYWKKQKVQQVMSVLTGVSGVTNELAIVPSRTYEDKLIADSIVAALERNIHMDVSTIDVRVNGGEVTLSGRVSSLPAFRAAQSIAEDTPGVVAVNNDLEIR